jgi:anti-sigma factor RsiW
LSAHLTARQIEGFNGRSASPAELLAAMNHIASCEACREQVSSEQKTRAAVVSLQADLSRQPNSDHVSYEALARCVDDTLNQADREVLESHVGLCAHCADELADLRAFKAEMTTYPEIERTPAASPTLRDKLIAFLRAPSYRISIRLAGAAMVVLLCVSIATLLLRKENAVTQPEISELQNKDAAAQEHDVNAEPQNASPRPAAPVTEIAESIHDGGSVVAMDTEGKLRGLESLPAAYEKEVRTALTNKRVETPSDLRELIGKTGVLMGTADNSLAFSLIGPVGTIVKIDKPTFRWKPLSGATSYVVAVYDSGFNLVASSESQTGAEWSSAIPLKRGETYSWQVTAIKDGKELVSPAPPAPDAKFKILDASKTKEIDQAKRTYPDSHLVLGVLYERAGLLDDAERELRALTVANPKSQTARKLLNDLKSLRRSR